LLASCSLSNLPIPAISWHNLGDGFLDTTGSLGAPWKERAESTPRLCQLLEIRADRRSIRVHTRGLKKLGGAWGPWYEWPDPKDPDKRHASYEFTF
jgi:hypothetical protein